MFPAVTGIMQSPVSCMQLVRRRSKREIPHGRGWDGHLVFELRRWSPLEPRDLSLKPALFQDGDDFPVWLHSRMHCATVVERENSQVGRGWGVKTRTAPATQTALCAHSGPQAGGERPGAAVFREARAGQCASLRTRCFRRARSAGTTARVRVSGSQA